MLVLSRKVGEELIIGGNIRIKVNRLDASRVSLAIDAPDDVRVLRGELQEIRSGFESDPAPGRDGAKGLAGPVRANRIRSHRLRAVPSAPPAEASTENAHDPAAPVDVAGSIEPLLLQAVGA